MPKMKTHKGIKKRVRVSARGTVIYKRSFSGHLMSGKPGDRVRKLRRKAAMPSVLAVKVREALGV